jgi:hypothetical protein
LIVLFCCPVPDTVRIFRDNAWLNDRTHMTIIWVQCLPLEQTTDVPQEESRVTHAPFFSFGQTDSKDAVAREIVSKLIGPIRKDYDQYVQAGSVLQCKKTMYLTLPPEVHQEVVSVATGTSLLLYDCVVPIEVHEDEVESAVKSSPSPVAIIRQILLRSQTQKLGLIIFDVKALLVKWAPAIMQASFCLIKCVHADELNDYSYDYLRQECFPILVIMHSEKSDVELRWRDTAIHERDQRVTVQAKAGNKTKSISWHKIKFMHASGVGTNFVDRAESQSFSSEFLYQRTEHYDGLLPFQPSGVLSYLANKLVSSVSLVISPTKPILVRTAMMGFDFENAEQVYSRYAHFVIWLKRVYCHKLQQLDQRNGQRYKCTKTPVCQDLKTWRTDEENEDTPSLLIVPEEASDLKAESSITFTLKCMKGLKRNNGLVRFGTATMTVSKDDDKGVVILDPDPINRLKFITAVNRCAEYVKGVYQTEKSI